MEFSFKCLTKNEDMIYGTIEKISEEYSYDINELEKLFEIDDENLILLEITTSSLSTLNQLCIRGLVEPEAVDDVCQLAKIDELEIVAKELNQNRGEPQILFNDRIYLQKKILKAIEERQKVSIELP